MENSELLAKVDLRLNNVSAALDRLHRERELLRETRTQIMMGLLSAEQIEANLSRLSQCSDSNGPGLSADIMVRLRHAGL